MLEIEYVIQYEQNVLDSGDLKNVFPYLSSSEWKVVGFSSRLLYVVRPSVNFSSSF